MIVDKMALSIIQNSVIIALSILKSFTLFVIKIFFYKDVRLKTEKKIKEHAKNIPDDLLH